jgi:allantoicase
MSFGRVQNLIYPGRSTHMGDGWETRRRRGPGNDWAVIRSRRRARSRASR